MSTNEQRIAIAEACGYVWYRVPKHAMTERRYRFLALPVLQEHADQSGLWKERAEGWEGITNWQYMEVNGQVPNYLEDLNAMRQAETTLTIENFAAYENHLCATVDRSGTDSDIWFYVLTAASAQRAEAFLRTVGRWKEQ